MRLTLLRRVLGRVVPVCTALTEMVQLRCAQLSPALPLSAVPLTLGRSDKAKRFIKRYIFRHLAQRPANFTP